jgi:hypothetical protein
VFDLLLDGVFQVATEYGSFGVINMGSFEDR